jgi:serine/threonine-protein kinase
VSKLSGLLNAALAGRYAIQRELGTGGMATVFLAEDLKHHRSVAIKVLHPELAAALGSERFLREIEIAAGLHHPHILPLHDSGVADGLLYYVMPYAADESLRQRLAREKQLPLADALRITHEVADALDYAHRHGVVHRDIKPENILLAEQHAMVADFGIARAIQAAGGDKLTATGVVIGTPAYMSPEQTAGSRQLDGRSDQYSLGCVLYEMLAGQPPFTGPTVESLAHQHLSVAARPVTDLRPAVPKEVAHAIDRTLAKAAADRFPTTAEFAAAIVPRGEQAMGLRPEHAEEAQKPLDGRGIESQITRPMGRAPWRRRRLLVAGAIASIVLALAVWRLGPSLVRRHPPDPAKKSWILVAEFDGPAEDHEMLSAARELVGTALDQSEIVATVPRAQLKEALRLAGKPDTTRISGEVARELANRSSVRAVIEGEISRMGSARLVVLRAVSAEDGSTVYTATETAKDPDALIPVLGRLSRRLRDGLGEKAGAVRATQPLPMVATPSYEAYRLFVKGVDLYREGDLRRALVPLEEALRIDPDFAGAWMWKGWTWNGLFQPDSEVVAFEEASRHSDRLTESGKLYSSGMIAQLTGDLATADATWQQLARMNPNDANALANHAVNLGYAGRYEEALADLERAAKMGPFAPAQWIVHDVLVNSVLLGRLDEAREMARQLKGPNAHYWALGLAVAANDWMLADSLAVRFVTDPTVTIEVQIPARLMIAAGRAEAGALDAADQELRLAQAAGISANRADLAAQVVRTQALLAAARGGTPGALQDAIGRDTTTAGLITRGMWALAAGDRNLAQQVMRQMRARRSDELGFHGAGPALLEAWAAGESGHWDETVRILAPAARQGDELGYVSDAIGRVPMRWLVASAYDRLGRPDSAAAYFELALSPVRTYWEDRVPLRTVSSLTHRRLVLLYARMGRVEDAEHHWRAFATAVHSPDPGLRPLIEEARAALASARGVAASAGR